MAQQVTDLSVCPVQYGGYGKLEGEPHGGLADKFYPLHCPPVVTLDTIIIAVCGPNDYRDNASPQKDGWFFSDFYLFHHLFRGTAQKQYWMTCVDPGILVKKYSKFAHGDPKKADRRIVLDVSFKDEVADVKVFKPEDLLERFASYISEASKEVIGTNRPILILMFAHGIEKTFCLTIGGAGEYKKCTKLSRDTFRQALLRHNPNPNVAVLTTMCYGGGWAQSTFLKITTMAGTSAEEELLSWPKSESIGRYCGSRYATGVAEALIRTEIKELDLTSDEGEEVQQSPTYTALVDTIHHILTKEVDVRESNYMSFSAKDDMWAMEWRERTGFPLSEYQKKWEALTPVQQGGSIDHSRTVSIRFSEGIALSPSKAHHRLLRLVHDYMQSNPGDSSAAKNHAVHSGCCSLLKGEELANWELEVLAGSLQYRLIAIMDKATEYKDRLGLDFPDCRDCDPTTYKYTIKDQLLDKQLQDIDSMRADYDFFDTPEEHEGMPYNKGNMYLRLAFATSGWSNERVGQAMAAIMEMKSRLSVVYLTMRFLRFREERTVWEMIGTIAKSTKRRVRSMSPSKHPRKSLEAAFGQSIKR